MKKVELLRCLVGSHAHGLAREDSDYDYRGVYVVSTKEILSLGFNYKGSHWVEGESEDNTSYEIGHFLHLATKCNPTILEVFKAPIADSPFKSQQIWSKEDNDFIEVAANWGAGLRDLFPYVWNPKDAYNAFVGYSKNQEVKMLKDNTEAPRVFKYACAYLRTLYNLEQLLTTGDFTLDVTHNPEFFKRLKAIRVGDFTVGDILNESLVRKKKCQELLAKCNHKPDLGKVNEFLLKIRKEFWD